MFYGMHGYGCGSRRGRWRGIPLSFTIDLGGSAGPRKKMFERGELALVLLKLIADEPRHGYDLMRTIQEMTGGAYMPSAGVVYPMLAMLDEVGQLESEREGGVRKRYSITEDGRAHLARHVDEVEALIARLTALGEAREKGDAAPVRRAMANLKAVLENVDAATAHDIADVLDEAAKRIERLG